MLQPSVKLFDLLRIQAGTRPNEPATAGEYKPRWEKLSWGDYHAQARTCAAALIEHGIQPGDRVVLLSENRPEWLVADMGILAAGAVTVPVHATLEREQVEFQVR